MNSTFEKAIANLSEIEIDAGISRRLRDDLDLVEADPHLVESIKRVIRFLEVGSAQATTSHKI